MDVVPIVLKVIYRSETLFHCISIVHLGWKIDEVRDCGPEIPLLIIKLVFE